MTQRYRLFRRGGTTYYAEDTVTGKQESLRTRDEEAARAILAARNEAARVPMLNREIAKAYLRASSPEMIERTWADVASAYAARGAPASRARTGRAFRSAPFRHLLGLRLIDSDAAHFFAVLEHRAAGNSTNHYLRRLHNFALGTGWLLQPVIAPKLWPVVRHRHYVAITAEEQDRIVASEKNTEHRLYYQMLWETGGSQSDIAALTWDRVDREHRTIAFYRKKLAGLGDEQGLSVLSIGPRIRAILDQLPREGHLFPTLARWTANHRATEFARRCRISGIKGKALHSYRYSWAERASQAGMPERDAMSHLGHGSKAVHRAYARLARAKILPLEHYEAIRDTAVIDFEKAAAPRREGPATEKADPGRASAAA